MLGRPHATTLYTKILVFIIYPSIMSATVGGGGGMSATVGEMSATVRGLNML